MMRQADKARWLALLAVTAIVVYLCWLMLRPLFGVLAWAAVLVIVFYPLHRRILRRTGRASWSAVLSCLLVLCVVLVPLGLIALALVHELTGVAQTLQQFASTFLDPNTPLTGRLANWLSRYVNLEQLRSSDFIMERLKNMSGTIAGRTVSFLGNVAGLVVQVFFVIYTMYYLFRDGERIAHALPGLIPLDRTRSAAIIARTKDVIDASVYGVLSIAAIQGTLGGVAFLVLGLPSALLWGVVMFFLSMIPMAGSFVVWVPAALFLLVTGHWVKALLLTIWGTLVIGMVDNFLRPKLVGERAQLHELFIFFSVLGGLQVFGVLGLVLGPVVLAVALALLDVMRRAGAGVTSEPQAPNVAALPLEGHTAGDV